MHHSQLGSLQIGWNLHLLFNAWKRLDRTLLVTIYRPVSNIPFISKVNDRVVAQLLNNHLTKNGLHGNLQSAYKSFTSTDAAILRIEADVEKVLDEEDT